MEINQGEKISVTLAKPDDPNAKLKKIQKHQQRNASHSEFILSWIRFWCILEQFVQTLNRIFSRFRVESDLKSGFRLIPKLISVFNWFSKNLNFCFKCNTCNEWRMACHSTHQCNKWCTRAWCNSHTWWIRTCSNREDTCNKEWFALGVNDPIKITLSHRSKKSSNKLFYPFFIRIVQFCVSLMSTV